ncbi:hypothetical protein Cni_G13597 [Canna indica]|uniref:F-box domain-containing protein n=1 Tax=Canna indica TaxID=4628 RepID=A0AAQ3QDW6_9LILI|nr:hypothetical protein Cni_G13597 [Canna indica]
MAVGNIHQSGLKFVRNTRILGTKRVELSNYCPPIDSPSPKRPSRMPKSNRLEALPQDILVKVLCKVDHSDLKQLLLVSKLVNGATLTARELHFAFSTPSSKSMFKREMNVADGEEAPDAPRQRRIAKSRLDGSKLSSIVVALFRSPEETELVSEM